MRKSIGNFKQPSIEDAIRGELSQSEPKKITYSDKLKNPLWQRKRLEILQRDNFQCQSCLTTLKELNVHHFNYLKEPWDSENFELITLCKDCHSIYHKIFDVFDKSIIANLSDLYWIYIKTVNRKSRDYGNG